jgi:hypothetical protein
MFFKYGEVTAAVGVVGFGDDLPFVLLRFYREVSGDGVDQ